MGKNAKASTPPEQAKKTKEHNKVRATFREKM